MTDKPILDTLRGKRQSRPPIWFMRQAGRYLPEYREIRAEASDFLSMCYTPSLATEVTLQPIRRFDLDAAILFSDILVVADGLGQSVRFEEGQGPVLDPLDAKSIAGLDATKVTKKLAPVLETVANVRAALSPEKTLLGFCGAPWTVATYMIGGRGSTDQALARKFALAEPEAFDKLLSVLVDASVDYLVAQIEAGADAVQVFESWAQNVDEDMFRRLVIEPNRRIVEGVRARVPEAVMIGFPRGAGANLVTFAERTGFSAIGIDHMVPLAFAATAFNADVPLQGNLDPLRLIAGGAQLDRRIDDIVSSFSDRPHVFNLGHGVVPETPIAHVEQMNRAGEGTLKMEWVKALHVISVIAWMAAMFYLPRLFVYHCGAEKGSVQSETFKIMERRLMAAIMTPAMIASWVAGLLLVFYYQTVDWTSAWSWIKTAAVIVLTGLHFYNVALVKTFAEDRNTKPHVFFRYLNEMPTILMIVIVIMVIVKPF